MGGPWNTRKETSDQPSRLSERVSRWRSMVKAQVMAPRHGLSMCEWKRALPPVHLDGGEDARPDRSRRCGAGVAMGVGWLRQQGHASTAGSAAP